MVNQKTMSNFDMITLLLSKRVDDIDLDTAYTLADMAVRGEHPDEKFSKEECILWSKYRFWISVIHSKTS